MGFRQSTMEFYESSIEFVQPVIEQLKEAVGETTLREEIGNIADDVSNTSTDFSMDKDLLDKVIEKKIKIESGRAGTKRNQAKEHKREYRRLRPQERAISNVIRQEEERNVVVHGIFDEKNANYQRLKEKFVNTDWSQKAEEKKNARYRLNNAKEEARKAYIDVEESNAYLNRLADNKQDILNKQQMARQQKTADTNDAKKHEKKVAILKTVLSAKDGIVNGSNQDAGNLIEAGQTGVVGSVLRAVNPIEIAKTKLKQMVAAAALTLLKVCGPAIMETMLALIIIIAIFASVLGWFSPSISSVASSSHTLYNSRYSDEQINELILQRGWEWEYDYDRYGFRIHGSERKVSTLPTDQQAILRFAFSKVGYPYSQELRTSGTHYDCSSLAYYSELARGKDITCSTAAGQAKKLYREGKSLPKNANLQIGDLIFYGGHDNGRFLGIYHVAIYAGNGYCVEAYNTRYGIIYGTARSKNVVMICRP